jgi:hypothetical protein
MYHNQEGNTMQKWRYTYKTDSEGFLVYLGDKDHKEWNMCIEDYFLTWEVAEQVVNLLNQLYDLQVPLASFATLNIEL